VVRELILASASPRRRELLRMLGVPFRVVESGVEEEGASGDPVAHVLSLSQRKASAVAGKIGEGFVVGVDTVVVLDREILGKPSGPEEARAILGKLSGRVHRVYSGVTVTRAEDGKVLSDYRCTEVRMRRMSPGEIDAYVATGEPLDKAGAYAIQGKGALLVEEIRGCFYNVVGLPLCALMDILAKMGWKCLEEVLKLAYLDNKKGLSHLQDVLRSFPP